MKTFYYFFANQQVVPRPSKGQLQKMILIISTVILVVTLAHIIFCYRLTLPPPSQKGKLMWHPPKKSLGTPDLNIGEFGTSFWPCLYFRWFFYAFILFSFYSKKKSTSHNFFLCCFSLSFFFFFKYLNKLETPERCLKNFIIIIWIVVRSQLPWSLTTKS